MRAGLLAVPHLSQEEEFTCVPACARMVLAFYGRHFPEAEIAALLGTDETGTRFRDLLRLSALGVEVQPSHGTRDTLAQLLARGVPCIARVKTLHLPRYPMPPGVPHAVVVVGVTRRLVHILDPAQTRGPDAVQSDFFDAAWAAGQRQYALISPGDPGADQDLTEP